MRSDAWQQRFLALPLPERRRIAADIRAGSRQRKSQQQPEQWADVDADEARRWLAAAHAPQMVHGHTHMPARHALGAGLTRLVLSDWDFDHPGAVRADVLRWRAEGLARVAPAVAQ